MDARAAVFTGPNQPFDLRRLVVREPRDSELLVRVTCCTLCGSDLHTYAGRRTGPAPAVLGHEIVGRIERFGATAPRRDLIDQPLRAGPVAVDPEAVVRQLLSIQGVHNYIPADLVTAVQFLTEHAAAFPFEELASLTFTLDNVDGAFQQAAATSAVRVAVRP